MRAPDADDPIDAVEAIKAIDHARIARLQDYLEGLKTGLSDGPELYRKHQADLELVTPVEIMELFNQRLEQGDTVEAILDYLDQAINVFAHSLKALANISAQSTPREAGESPSPFVDLLVAENRAIEQQLAEIRTRLLSDTAMDQAWLLQQIESLSAVNQHYLKKENILFPMLEKRHARFAGLKIMWALHDKARQVLKQAAKSLAEESLTDKALNTLLGQVFFVLLGLVKKENWLLFPLANQQLDRMAQLNLLAQCRDYPPALLDLASYQQHLAAAQDIPLQQSPDPMTLPAEDLAAAWLKTPTGSLNASQAIALFNALPVDLSFVDADNKLRYFTRPKDRIFPRSPAAIGRDVALCHPPASVHIVEQIIDKLRAGERDHARFWINLRGRKILIEYFAVRDEKDTYLGVLEVSQDITDLQELTGEQRLLDWT